ncbi:MAG TPA: hypothetical protein VLS49_05865 [Usitatibacter sp.]|nr:hypothetical protein [Usitatibacter sp.]
MLQIDKRPDPGVEGVTVFGDSDLFNVFYILPQQPRYRLDAQGRPSFGFYKYRFPVDRPDGKKGGGFLLFDIEFVVDPAKLQQVKDNLGEMVAAEARRRNIQPVPEVVIGEITYTKGTSELLYPEGLVTKVIPNGSKPSLYGNNVCTFALELPPEGATFFEQAMQGQGGAVSIRYDLWFWARLPAMKVTATFYASKFYSFYQTIDTDWNLWSEDSYRETIREQTHSSEWELIDVDPGGITDQKIIGQVRDWATKALEDAVQRNMIAAIAPVSADDRKAPDGIEDVTRDITNTQISDVHINYRESQTVEWNVVPQGVLQNITSLKDKSGNALKWSDYSRTIDLDDPFFKTLRVNTLVNADFAGLPIHSVEVKLTYKGRPMANLAEGEPDGEVVLASTSDTGKFAAYVEGDDWKYKYSYQVNYRGQSRQYQSPEVETNEGVLTIGVDDVGVIDVEVSAGDLNWAEIDRAAVTLSYEDKQHGVDGFEEQFQLTQAAPTYRIQRVIFEPMRNNYKYGVKYSMKNGLEYQGGPREARSQKLFINDVFDGRRTVSVRGVGDFAARIQSVFVDLEYKDAANKYTQTKSQALSATSPFFDWTFPVIDPNAGQVTYKAQISYKDGTTDTVPTTVATGGTILLPPAIEAFLEVQIVTDLIDWAEVRLARVSLSYADTDGGVTASKDFIFSPSSKASTSWKVELKNKEQDSFRYQVTYYLASGLQKTVGPVSTKDRALILDPSAAKEAQREAARAKAKAALAVAA